ncbi:MAG: HlyC/CorC family transporter [Thermoanaerobaculia bacterium]|nr:MAG: HlyC/CorC family transporter [Thermoanaerobaculia bacterium]
MPEPPSSLRWLALALALLPLVPLSSLMTALLERSGPIRMRHWVEEAGGRMRALYENTVRFEVFRYLLNLIAKLSPLALFAAAWRGLSLAGSTAPWALAGLLVAATVAATELGNRSLLARDSERSLRRLTWVFRLAFWLLSPLVLALAALVPRRLEEQEPAPEPEDEASEEEVEAFIEVGTREGILEPGDRDMVWGVVDFGDTQVRSVMTPRVDVIAASVDEPLEALAERFIESSVSRMPLYRESVDQVVGVLHIRDLLAGLRRSPRPASIELAQPPLLVPETKLLGDLLREFQARRQHLAVVINEWGGTEGVVTVEDLVEEIVGEIADEHDEGEPENRLLPDGSLLLDGRATVETLDEFFAWRPDTESSETVGGLVSGLVGYVPQAGEIVEHEGLRFEVERADERRILALRVRRSEAPAGTRDA